MNTKHILLTSALVVSALAFTSCEDFFDTSSKKDLNTETAYSNLESAEMALVGCYDGWQRTISDEGVGMYLLAEFASEQAFAGLGLSDAKNNNVIDQFNLGIAPSYNDIFNVDWQNYYKAIFRCNQLIVQEDNIDWAGDIKAQGQVRRAQRRRTSCGDSRSIPAGYARLPAARMCRTPTGTPPSSSAPTRIGR